MNKKQVSEAYKVLLQASNGAQRVKVDLHVHTPASHDFVCLPLQDAEAYINVLDQAIEQDIGIIAITDHNTFAGVRYIRKLLKDPEQSKKYGRLLILCGIEITCFSKHLIAIFPETFDEKMQDKFLDEIGIDESARGSEDALADNLGPALLIDKISANNGFAILAHADSNKGFLQNMCGNRPQENELSFSGKSLAKIVQNKGLLAVQCNSDKNAKTLKTKLKNKEYNREFNALAFLKCSDCHGVCINGEYNSSSGSPLGKFYSIIKLSELSFEALKMALLDSEMRVDDNSVQTNYAYIEGVAVKSRIFGLNNECKYFRFCNELNCIIGSRGTGKTTLLEIIQSVIMPNSFQDIDRNRAYSKYNSAVVFLKIEDKVYAIASEPKKRTDSYGYEVEYQPEIKIYSKDKNSNNFKPYNKDEQDEFLKRFLTAGYQQRQLYDYSKDPQKILGIVDDFLNWRNCSDFRKVVGQISYQVNELDGLLKRIKKERFNSKSRFSEYVDTYGHVRTIVGMISRIGDLKIKLHDMRASMIAELNEVLTGKVRMKIWGEINNPDWKRHIDRLGDTVAHYARKPYEYRRLICKCLNDAYVLSKCEGRVDFYSLLLEKKYDEICKHYRMPKSITEMELSRIRECIEEDDVQAFVEDTLSLEYNINAGTSFDENFKDNRQISMGQNAVALLLLILNASYSLSDNRPLLMDQPEDDLDNSYIYSTLVKEFRNSKQKRQIIISTHNPNIPVAADAENIMVLRFDGSCGYLDKNGAIDSHIIANDVVEIMEGGAEAIMRRMGKYNVRGFISN